VAQELLIGIDGGGTHSTAAAAFPDGRIAAVAYGGGLNYHNIGVENVRRNLEDMVTDLCEKTGAEVGRICVGMSALDGPADGETTDLFTGGRIAAGTLDLQSDAYAALMGSTMGGPGMIVICGTGSMLLMMDSEGIQHAGGGWGYLLNDAGSGFTLAREALLAAIDAVEGIGPETPLLGDAMAFFGAEKPRGLIDRIYAPECTPDRIAGFARYVIERARAGERIASGILERNMRRLARLAAAMMQRAPEACCAGLYGGIFVHSPQARAIFETAIMELFPGATVKAPEFPPELGALIHLFKQRGTLSEEILEIMKSTYEEYRHE